MTPKMQIKMALSKKSFIQDLFLTKCIKIVSCSRLLWKKFSFRRFFNKMLQLPPVCGGVLYILASWESYIYDSQATNRSVAREGGGLLTGSLPCVLLVSCKSYTTPAARLCTFLQPYRPLRPGALLEIFLCFTRQQYAQIKTVHYYF